MGNDKSMFGNEEQTARHTYPDDSSLMDKTINTPGAWTVRANTAQSSWEAAMWSQDGQTARFDAVAAIIRQMCDEGDSILDYGCGTGAFCEFVPEKFKYAGYDFSWGMIQRAIREHGVSSNRKFYNIEPGGKFDHIIIIGTFNLAHQWSKQRTNTILTRLLPRTKKMLVLSCYAGDDESCIHYDPNDFLGFEPQPFFSYPRPNDLLVRFEPKGVGGS